MGGREGGGEGGRKGGTAIHKQPRHILTFFTQVCYSCHLKNNTIFMQVCSESQTMCMFIL